MKNNRIWIVPNNDLEAKTIIEMLEREGEEYIVTGQAWGASWENLEEEIKQKIEKAKKSKIEVYGVELQGNMDGVINIDHHIYGQDDRSNEKSSLEQVADILEVELTLDEQFVSANDKGYIPEMEKLGRKLGISQEDLKEIISSIRMRDREMQGVTIEQEVEAQEAIEKLGDISEKRDYISIDLPHSKTSTVTDRLYGKYDNLLITSDDGETNFFGTTEIINMLNEKFPGGWSGGQLDKGNGFWGGYADQSEIKGAVELMIEQEREAKKKREKIEDFWISKYQKNKIGTIAQASQAMQHGAWLREWQRVHGDEPRIKPITEKVNGEKVKIGEADIAVPWSKLPEFFRKGNEYGDIETVKFLRERIERGDTSELSKEEIHDLSEKENVKWSDGKHSLNPFQGYLYDFSNPNAFFLDTPLGEEDYGKFYPLRCYEETGRPEDLIPNATEEFEIRYNEAYKAFSRYYTTRLMQILLEEREDLEYYDFINFDITSVTTPEQIEELDKKLCYIVNSPAIQEYLEYRDADLEKRLYEQLRNEVEVEIKKDSDRIENAHKVYLALETGNMESLFEDPETAKWLEEEYDREIKEKYGQEVDEA